MFAGGWGGDNVMFALARTLTPVIVSSQSVGILPKTAACFRVWTRSRALSMASKRLRQPVHLVLDWDCTLTTADTLACIGSIAQFRDARLERRPGPETTGTTTWMDISRAYMNDYRNHKAAYFPKSAAVPDDEYREWLNGLKAVEMRSVLRAQSSSYFKGVTVEDVKKAAHEAQSSAETFALRPGWADLFELFLVDRASPEEPNAAARISIISVNWSETFIRWSLWYAAQQLDHPRKQDICQLINDMEISANEIQGLTSPLGSSGRLFAKKMHPIQTSADKAKHLPPSASKPSRRTSVESAAAVPPSRSRLPAVVYVGDSTTDYECLKAAEKGIWLADVPEIEYAAKFKETFAPLDSEAPRPLTAAEESGKDSLFWAPDLKAVATYLTHP